MQPKQNSKDYIVGMYVRLSCDDERQGESLSIENQKAILSEYIQAQGWSYTTLTWTTVFRVLPLKDRA